MRFHLDNDFLVYAISRNGSERSRLVELTDSSAVLQISAVAWYEFTRGPRTPDELAVARALFDEHGVIPFSEHIAQKSGEVFRGLGSPRRRAADIAIGVTAAAMEARLLSRNAADFAGIPDLRVEAVGP